MTWGAIGGAAIGVAGSYLINRGNRQGGTVTSTQSTDPWWATQPYLQDAFSRGQGLLGQPAIGPQSQYTQQAIAEQGRLATSPGLLSAAQQNLGSTIAGDYLDPSTNPALAAAGQSAMDRALAGVSSRFSGDNYGSSANREWMTRAATEALAPYYFGEYGRERGRQFDALSMAPGLQFAAIPQLYQAGQAEEQRGQAEVEAPWAQLARYRGLLTGVPGGQTTQQTPYFTNPYASALGGGLLGAQIYNQWPRSSSQAPPQASPDQYQTDWANAWEPFMGQDYGGGGGY